MNFPAEDGGPPQAHQNIEDLEGQKKENVSSLQGNSLAGGLFSLAISDVRFSTEKPSRKILNGLSGEFAAGTVTAILGSSGAGKSSLFSILVDRLRSIPGSQTVSGRFFLNGQEISSGHLRKFLSLVPQNSPLFAELSIRESLNYLAALKLPKKFSEKQRKERVEEILRVLDLQDCADQLIGAESDELGQRGLSGGQRRRAALAGELLSNCPILLLDEVNSGLDAFHSFTLLRMLQRVARTLNRTILMILHQPAHELAQFFDNILLLHHGQIVFHGPRSSLIPYFDGLNFRCPAFYNPFDYLFLKVLTTTQNPREESFNEETKSQSNDILDDEKVVEPAPLELAGLKNSSAPNELLLSSAEQERLEFLTSNWRASEFSSIVEKKIADYLVKSENLQSDKSLSSGQAEESRASLKTHQREDSIRSQLIIFDDDRIPFWRELSHLFARHQKIKSRTISKLWTEFFAQALMIFLGSIPFIQFSSSQSSILNRVGSLSYYSEITGSLALYGILDHFTRLRPVIRHDVRNGSYSLMSYLVAHSLIEQAYRAAITIFVFTIVYFMVGFQLSFVNYLVFVFSFLLLSTSFGFLGILLSALFDSLDVAIQFGEVFNSLCYLLQGYYINYHAIKPVLKQLGYLIPNQYLFQALVKNEFFSLSLDCPHDEPACSINNGEAVVREMHFLGDFSIGDSIGIAIALNGGLFALGYWALKKKFR